MHIKHTPKCLVLGLGSLLTLGLVSAARAQVDGPFTTSTPITGVKTDFNLSLAFPQFDTLGGTRTLQSIFFNLTNVDVTSTITVTNTTDPLTGSPSSGNVFTQPLFTMSDPGHFFSFSQALNTAPVNYDLAPGQTIVFSNLTASAAPAAIFDSSSAHWASIAHEYTGGGNALLNVGTFTQTFTANTGGNTSSGQTTVGDATGEITYTYTINTADTTPEPGSVALLGGLVVTGITLLYRRKPKRTTAPGFPHSFN